MNEARRKEAFEFFADVTQGTQDVTQGTQDVTQGTQDVIQGTQVEITAPTTTPTCTGSAVTQGTQVEITAPPKLVEVVTENLPTLVAIVVAALAVLMLLFGRKKRKGSAEDGVVTQINEESGAESIYKIGHAVYNGVRERQDDLLWVRANNTKELVEQGMLAVVADGAGRENAGFYASNVTCQIMCADFKKLPAGFPPKEFLLDRCARAQNELCACKEKNGVQLGCSMISVLIRGGEVYFLSVGDCRLYLYRSNALLQLNREHVCYTDTGAVSPPGSMHSDGISGRSKDVTSYIGKDNLNRIDRNINPFNLMIGDSLLLMTDGVYDALSEEEIVACMNGNALQSAQNICRAIENKQLPGQDNATVFIISR